MTQFKVDDMGAALALMAAPLGRARLTSALAEFKSVGAAFDALASDPDGECSRFLASADTTRLERALRRIDGTLLAVGDADYPRLLAEIRRPPPILAVSGDVAALARPAVAIVGTRRATMTGRMVATRLGREFAEAGMAVVSGMARGIDAEAHRGVVEATNAKSGSPVGVLGCGLDVVYPKENASLFAQVAREGLLISEFGIGSPPERWRFPLRNRTIAGLSLGVVVVEAHSAGGALSTAAAAREENREVMVVPGSVENSAAAGVMDLLRDGAAPVASARDAILAIGGAIDEARSYCANANSGTDACEPSEPGDSLHDSLLDLLGDRVERSAFDLADALGASLADIVDALQPMVAAGQVVRGGEGYFSVPPGT